MDQKPNAPQAATAGVRSHHRLRRIAAWVSGGLILALIIALALHLGDIEAFVQLARHARPAWLVAAAVLQAGTYLCLALVWKTVLSAFGAAVPLRTLLRLAVAKFALDQTVPTGGISGTVLLVHSLARRGAPASAAMATFLAAMVSFYAASALTVGISLAFLWGHGQVHPALLAACGVFSLFAVGVSVLLLSGPVWISRPRLANLRPFRALAAAMSGIPATMILNPKILAGALALQLAIIILDSSTLALVFMAIGHTPPLWVVFSSFCVASAVAIVGVIPLGPFEASSAGMLALLGVPVEAALTATLLLRGFTLWLPLVPGLLFARHEVAAR